MATTSKLPLLQCPNCAYKVTIRAHLEEHMKLHEPGSLRDKFTCHTCQAIFATAVSLRMHQKQHLQGKCVCASCGKTFIFKRQLHLHIKKEHRFTCIYCEEMLMSYEDYLTHVEDYHPNNFKCDVCNKFLKNKKALRQHKQIHDKGGNCKKCGVYFPMRRQLRAHQLRCGKTLLCDVDGCRFSTKEVRRMEKHKLKHQTTVQALPVNYFCLAPFSFFFGRVIVLPSGYLFKTVRYSGRAKADGTFTTTFSCADCKHVKGIAQVTKNGIVISSIAISPDSQHNHLPPSQMLRQIDHVDDSSTNIIMFGSTYVGKECSSEVKVYECNVNGCSHSLYKNMGTNAWYTSTRSHLHELEVRLEEHSFTRRGFPNPENTDTPDSQYGTTFEEQAFEFPVEPTDNKAPETSSLFLKPENFCYPGLEIRKVILRYLQKQENEGVFDAFSKYKEDCDKMSSVVPYCKKTDVNIRWNPITSISEYVRYCPMQDRLFYKRKYGWQAMCVGEKCLRSSRFSQFCLRHNPKVFVEVSLLQDVGNKEELVYVTKRIHSCDPSNDFLAKSFAASCKSTNHRQKQIYSDSRVRQESEVSWKTIFTRIFVGPSKVQAAIQFENVLAVYLFLRKLMRRAFAEKNPQVQQIKFLNHYIQSDLGHGQMLHKLCEANSWSFCFVDRHFQRKKLASMVDEQTAALHDESFEKDISDAVNGYHRGIKYFSKVLPKRMEFSTAIYLLNSEGNYYFGQVNSAKPFNNISHGHANPQMDTTAAGEFVRNTSKSLMAMPFIEPTHSTPSSLNNLESIAQIMGLLLMIKSHPTADISGKLDTTYHFCLINKKIDVLCLEKEWFKTLQTLILASVHCKMRFRKRPDEDFKEEKISFPWKLNEKVSTFDGDFNSDEELTDCEDSESEEELADGKNKPLYRCFINRPKVI